LLTASKARTCFKNRNFKQLRFFLCFPPCRNANSFAIEYSHWRKKQKQNNSNQRQVKIGKNSINLPPLKPQMQSMTRTILLLDNYDSFTHNLLHLLQQVRPEYRYRTIRNTSTQLFSITPAALIIGPGPMTPAETGLLNNYFQNTIKPKNIPTLGVCLGMQYLGFEAGLSVTKSTLPAHGAAIEINHNTTDIFTGLPTPTIGARYNSLEIASKTIPANHSIEVLATAQENGAVMALRHKKRPHVGVQFHPESFLTTKGHQIIDNFFQYYVEI
jgi:anthranilate synthase/aminodeoxychorismate synthase-like glutamine amidotransferase